MSCAREEPAPWLPRGKAATAIDNGRTVARTNCAGDWAQRRASICRNRVTSSAAVRRPSGCACHEASGAGGSPRSARKERTPASRNSSTTAAISAREVATQVRCAIGLSDVSARMRETRARVVWRVEPEAPYVTDTKSGRAASRWRIVSHNRGAAVTSRGGNSSKDTVGLSVAGLMVPSPTDYIANSRPSDLSIGPGGSTLTLAGGCCDVYEPGLSVALDGGSSICPSGGEDQGPACLARRRA